MAENIERGAYLKQSTTVRQVNLAAIDAVSKLHARGVARGLFRPRLDPIDIHASISALSFFNVSNQYTFGLICRRDTQAPKALGMRRANVVDMVMRFVCVCVCV